MKLQPEIWKPSRLPGLSVSSWGRVKIEPYESKMPNGGTRYYVGKPTYGVWDDDHKRFNFLFKRKTYKVHQLVCEAFNGPKPFPKAVVMHDDEDASHNWPSNLIWGTQKENLNYPGFRAKVSANVSARKLASMQIAA
jgi:hypothetical protein